MVHPLHLRSAAGVTNAIVVCADKKVEGAGEVTSLEGGHAARQSTLTTLQIGGQHTLQAILTARTSVSALLCSLRRFPFTAPHLVVVIALAGRRRSWSAGVQVDVRGRTADPVVRPVVLARVGTKDAVPLHELATHAEAAKDDLGEGGEAGCVVEEGEDGVEGIKGADVGACRVRRQIALTPAFGPCIPDHGVGGGGPICIDGKGTPIVVDEELPVRACLSARQHQKRCPSSPTHGDRMTTSSSLTSPPSAARWSARVV